MPKPRLCLIAPSAYTLSGLAAWLDVVIPGLERSGWDVVLGLVEGAHHHRPSRYVAAHAHERWIAIPSLTGTQQGRRDALIRALLHTRPNVVAGVNIPDTYLAANALRQRGVPISVAMTVHGVQPDLFDDLRLYAGILDAAICTNQLACRLAQSRSGLDPARVLYAPYGVRPAPVKRNAPAGVLRIGWVGRLEQDQKRIMDLPPIIAALRRRGVAFHLTIFGDGPERSALAAALGESVADGCVSLAGYVPAERMQEQVYPTLDALLITSAWETGPIVAWEAMAAGVSVVAARYLGSGAEAALRHRRTAMLFDVGDAEAAADALALMATDSNLVDAIRQGGSALLQARYSAVASARAWDGVLRRILELPPKAAVADLKPVVAAGRLDRYLGPKLAERARRLLHRRGPDRGPGGEWPHSHGRTPYSDPAFWAEAKRLDSGEDGP